MPEPSPSPMAASPIPNWATTASPWNSTSPRGRGKRHERTAQDRGPPLRHPAGDRAARDDAPGRQGTPAVLPGPGAPHPPRLCRRRRRGAPRPLPQDPGRLSGDDPGRLRRPRRGGGPGPPCRLHGGPRRFGTDGPGPGRLRRPPASPRLPRSGRGAGRHRDQPGAHPGLSRHPGRAAGQPGPLPRHPAPHHRVAGGVLRGEKGLRPLPVRRRGKGPGDLRRAVHGPLRILPPRRPPRGPALLRHPHPGRGNERRGADPLPAGHQDVGPRKDRAGAQGERRGARAPDERLQQTGQGGGDQEPQDHRAGDLLRRLQPQHRRGMPAHDRFRPEMGAQIHGRPQPLLQPQNPRRHHPLPPPAPHQEGPQGPGAGEKRPRPGAHLRPPPLPDEDADLMVPRVAACGLTHQGRVRENNEDAYLYDDAMGLVAVADGMGGHAAGEVASRIACEAIREFVVKSESNQAITWPLVYRKEFSREWNRLLGALSLANGRILKYAKEHQKYLGMGTTVVAGLLRDGRLTYAHVGDSRIYRHADGVLTLLTEDHSWVQEQIRLGNLTPEQAEHHPLRNVVTRALGGAPQIYVDLAEKILAPGETYLFCTDGLTGAIPDAAIGAALGDGLPLQEKAGTLVRLALEAGGPDNVTVFLIEVPKQA
ncbi:MAG TPA: hypothetical protein DCS11_08230 [Syntrophus sp. (in: bacteria)]|nr:hypothetical protein [Syntrophus sp. (in: bacteria)]